MSKNTELDKIINEGKVSSATAMVVFAVELKSQGDKLDELKKSIDSDNARYVTKTDFDELARRVSRIENAILRVLAIVFILVLTAAIGIAIKGGKL